MPRRAMLPYLALFAGVLIASTASIMIRFAQGMGVHSLSIAAGRLALAALILTPLALTRARPELRRLGRRDLLLALGAGAFLAVHFASWISSLAYTSVASSAALVSTNPLWVGLASLLIFRERLGWRGGLGIALTILGTAVIGLSDSGASAQPAPLLGNGLALLGALAGSGYLLIGRSLRRRVSVLTYIWLVYSAAGVILLAVAALAGQSVLGLPAMAYLLLLGLAVGPQLIGHTSFNYALGALSATFVAVALLGEPVGSAILAVLIFREAVAPLQVAGIALLLLGILLAS
ncbi:DMT family transporter, partial [Oscillochloris sp. ZM17-4]|uniref:DMT family transporter n=1 Tax=Oscillochloris sp. ZM17-4 TaxID=2866714 RepID=UPI001C72B4A2